MSNNFTSKGIYHWKLGDVALARMCKKVYAKVKVVKNKNGLFYDDKVLGITAKDDGSVEATEELCYYVEIIRSGQRVWLPYTCMYLAERSRPFYGTEKVAIKTKVEKPAVVRKRKLIEEHIVPMDVKLSKLKEPDLNTTYDMRHMPLKQGKYENAFKEFVRRGKEMLFDQFYNVLERNRETNDDILDYLKNVDASTEDKFETVIKDTATLKELENYLNSCWRYNFVHKQLSVKENKENIDPNGNLSNSAKPVTVHISWCIVCGEGGRLRDCPACPSAFHLACRREWLLTIIHRKNPPQKPDKATTFVKKILSSTRTICAVNKEKENIELCPSCMWGPRVGYDDVVWHKLGTCSWWPARVLPPGAAPSCLLSRQHSPVQWPVKYYGTLNHSWADSSRMCLFLPTHAQTISVQRDPTLQQAVLDACDDYIVVYLT